MSPLPRADDLWSAPERRLASSLARLEVHRRVVDQQAPLGSADGRLLWLLGERGACTLREIADELGREQSTVNRQVNAAIDAGLVARVRDPDRAARLIEPAEAGSVALTAARRYSQELYRAGVAGMSAAEHETFLDLLERFVTDYGAALDRP